MSYSRVQLIKVSERILNAIRTGKVGYREDTFVRDLRCYRYRAPISVVSAILLLFFGGLTFLDVQPALPLLMLFAGMLGFTHYRASSYETLARQFLQSEGTKAVTANSATSVADELLKLNSLKKDGAISDSEYEALKRKVM